MKRLTCLTLCAVAAAGLATGAHAQCQYELTVIQAPDCPPFGPQPTFGYGINSAAEVVGYHCACICTSDQAFRWTAKTGLVELAEPPGTGSSRASDINDMGWIVGNFCIPGDGLGEVAFLHNGVEVISLGTLPGGTFSRAAATNDAGQIVGVWGNNVVGDPGHAAFLWQDGVMIDLRPDLGGMDSNAYDINAAGQVVGWMGESYLSAQAFIWDEGVVSDLGVIPGGLTGEGRAINNIGQVAGQGLIESPKDGSLVLHALFWDNGKMTDIWTLPGTTFSRAFGLNDKSQVVGLCNNPGLTDLTAFIWESGVMVDLNDLINDKLNLHMKAATAINNAGQITGWAEDDIGDAVAVILTPIPPPGDLDGDCSVGIADFQALLLAWGPCPGACPPSCAADLDGDCDVGIVDFLALLANWG